MADKLARAKLARAAKRLGAQSGLPALVLMTDDERLADPLMAARALPRGSMIILRARQSALRARLAGALREVAYARGLRLLIAGDPELAARIGASGIHLSESRAREAAHWRALHPGWIITAAAHSLSACMSIRDADALIVAPVFATASHPDGKTLGPIGLRLIARAVRLPIYALGGIDALSARRLAGTGLAGLAAIGALAV